MEIIQFMKLDDPLITWFGLATLHINFFKYPIALVFTWGHVTDKNISFYLNAYGHKTYKNGGIWRGAPTNAGRVLTYDKRFST